MSFLIFSAIALVITVFSSAITFHLASTIEFKAILLIADLPSFLTS
jgi:hypothetical protein